MSGYLTVEGLDGYHRLIPPLSSSNEFNVLVCQDGRWRIEVNSMTKENDIMCLIFDGADTYFVHYQDSIFGITNGRPGIIATEPFTNHLNNAIVSAGDYPFAALDPQARAQALWLAFAAGSYLHLHPQESMPLPWMPARLNLLAYGFRSEYELSENAPYCIQNLKFIRSTAFDLTDSKELDRPELNRGDISFHSMLEEQLEKRKMLWPDGFVAGTFHVSENTNYDGVELPLEFSLDVFNPQLKNKDKLSRAFEGIVTNLTRIDLSSSPSLPILSELLVSDERMRYESSTKIKTDVHYHLKPGGNWLSRDAELVTNLFEAGLHSHASDRNRYYSKRTKTIVIRTALILSLAFPIIIIIYFKSKLLRMKP
jgi:hypothetical protein